MPSRPVIALLIVLLVVPTASAIAIGSAPPIDVCDPCGRTISNVAVENSTASIQVHENGSATWEVRNGLDTQVQGATTLERFRENASYLREFVRESLDRSYAYDDPVLLEASISGDVVTMRYRTDFAVRTFGVLRVEYLRNGYHASSFAGLGADRLTISPPEGYEITSGLPEARNEDGKLVLTSFEPRAAGPFVVFGPDGGIGDRVSTAASIAAVILPRIAYNVLWLVLLPGVVLAGLLALEVAAVRRVVPEGSAAMTDRLGYALLGLGGVVAVVSMLPGGVSVFGTNGGVLLAGGIATAVVGLAAIVAPRRLDVSGQATVIAVGLVTGGAALLMVSVIDSSAVRVPTPILAVAALPVLAGLPTGYLARTGGRRRLVALALPPIAMAAAVALLYPLAAPSRGFYFVGVLLLVLSALGIAVFALPFLALGTALPNTRDGT